MMRLVALAALSAIALLGTPPETAVSSTADAPPNTAVTSAAVEVASTGTPTTVPEPASRTEGDDPDSTTTTSSPEPPEEGGGPESTTTSQPEGAGDVDNQGSTTTPGPESAPTDSSDSQESPTTSVAAAVVAPVRPGASPQVRDSEIPLGSIVLALIVLTSVGAVSYRLFRRRPEASVSDGTPWAAAAAGQAPPSAGTTVVASTGVRTALDSSTTTFLIGLGEALMDAGAAVSHVESALRRVAGALGSAGVGVLVLPTAIIVSVPDGDDLVTQLGAPGRAPLRLDQIDDVLHLVQKAESGAIGASEGVGRLAAIRVAPAPYSSRLVLLGHVCASAGLAAILHATWVEIVLAALLGAVVGTFRVWTRRLNSSYQPFAVLIAAASVSTTVFALSRVMDNLLTFPLVVAPLITFLPGGLLTIAVLELATGQIVSGASRLASGGLQLILLALGIVAGGQLVGVPAAELGLTSGGTVAALTPWFGVALYGIGVVWFYGARSSARMWILLVLFVAYAGQVIGGLFFGSALSAFFGALAMTPIAVLAARRSHAPSPLVTILPGFWLLVPGALGLDGVTRLFGSGGAAATGVLMTTATSMVGVSLGILLGLLLVASDPEHPWSEALIGE